MAGSRPLAPTLLLLSALLPGTTAARQTVTPGYEYVSPLPGSRLVRAWNGVILRTGTGIDPSTVAPDRLQVVGSVSGLHPGSLALSDDGKTLTFVLDAPYTPGETVTVTLLPGLRSTNGYPLPPLDYSFLVSPQVLSASARRFDSVASEAPPTSATPTAVGTSLVRSAVRGASSCDLPEAYPDILVLSSDQPDSGDLFLAPFSSGGGGFASDGHLLIVDSQNVPIFWRHDSNRALDFRQQPNGNLSYLAGGYAYLMDDTYAVVDSLAPGNGYAIDGHDFQLLPNGHAVLMSYDPQPVRMDSLVPGGNPDAIVEGLVLQELDLARRVVFQWRSWDWIPITDCNSSGVDLTGADIDYVHGNAVEVDADGNWLVSSRHLSEITKISRTTGEVLWRMGRNAVGNQFAFPNDPRGFSHQHDVRRLSNGHLTLFDNGNFLSPQTSRALELDVDEVNKVATVVWEYGTEPSTFGPFMGGVHTRPGQNRLVCWGGNNATALRISELHDDDSPALELGLPPATWTYRAYRLPWHNRRIDVRSELVDFGTVGLNDPDPILPVVVRNGSTTPVTIDCVTASHPAFTTDAIVPVTLAPGDSITWQVKFHSSYVGTIEGRLYVHSISDSEIVAGVTSLRAVTDPLVQVGNDGPTRFGLREIRPNPASARASFTFDVPRRGPVALEVFGVHGDRIATILSGVKEAGRHEVSWDASRLPRGLYFCRLSAADRVVTRKLVRVD